MLRITIDLISARDNSLKTIGRMWIHNDATGNIDFRNYKVNVMRRGDIRHPLFGGKITRSGVVENYPAARFNVWRLIIRALKVAFPEEK